MNVGWLNGAQGVAHSDLTAVLFVFWDTAPKGARHPYFQSHQMDCDGSWLDQVGFVAPQALRCPCAWVTTGLSYPYSGAAVCRCCQHPLFMVQSSKTPQTLEALLPGPPFAEVVNRQGSHILKSGAHWGSAVLFPGEVMEHLTCPNSVRAR